MTRLLPALACCFFVVAASSPARAQENCANVKDAAKAYVNTHFPSLNASGVTVDDSGSVGNKLARVKLSWGLKLGTVWGGTVWVAPYSDFLETFGDHTMATAHYVATVAEELAHLRYQTPDGPTMEAANADIVHAVRGGITAGTYDRCGKVVQSPASKGGGGQVKHGSTTSGGSCSYYGPCHAGQLVDRFECNAICGGSWGGSVCNAQCQDSGRYMQVSAPPCGDGVCDCMEACDTCAADCGDCSMHSADAACGDGSCQVSEGCDSCPGDCGTCAPYCGDGVCSGEISETCTTCAYDCGSCQGWAYCGDGVCDTNAGECSTCAGDCATTSSCTVNDY